MVRRFILILFMLLVPPLLTALLYFGSEKILILGHKVADPRVLNFAAFAEILLFYFGAVLEVKDRWSPPAER